MKTRIQNLAIASVLGMSLFACNTEELENKISSLETEKQNLEQKYQAKDSTLAAFIESFAEIEGNLAEIREREMNIQLSREENNLNPEELKARIQEDVQAINQLLDENREKINTLNAQLKYSGRESAKLKKSMEELQASLTAKIEEREAQIAQLGDELKGLQMEVESLNANLTSLNEQNEMKAQTISMKDDELNTAYFVTGTSKELLESQILVKEGGFLGFLGRSKVIADDFNREAFNKIDTRETFSIPVEAEEVELASVHPTDSYSLEKEGEEKVTLHVSDPAKFWASSKYLVMVKK
ncbi:MAG: hypothetical protein ACLFUB_05070 [Cyclobacteriaceae bacterium]